MPVLTDPRFDPVLGAHDPEAPLPGSTSIPIDTAPPSTPSGESPDRQPRRWPYVVVGAIAVAAAATAGVAVFGNGGDTAGPVDTTPIRAVTAEVRDLIEYTDLDGRMTYANAATLTAAADGVVTAVAGEDETLERGDIAYEVNDRPVTVFYGDAPLYRELAEGASGDDVVALEENLASLGYHASENEDGDLEDTGFTVDGVYDSATTAAVVRWQDDVGLPLTGTVAPADAVVLDGPAVVTEVIADIGTRTQTAAPVLELNTIATVSASYSQHTGEVELLVEPGTELVSGFVVYTVDELPVVGLVSDVEFDRDLAEGIEPGDDVEVLEAALVALGYDADGDLEIDDEFDAFTTEALTDYEEDLQDAFDDVVVDGVLALSEFAVFEPGMTVGDITDNDDVIALGTELWSSSLASDQRIVETEIEVADQALLAEGTVVDVEFPTGDIVQGTVTDQASSSTVDAMDPDAEPTFAVEITLASVPESAAGLNELDVEVKIVEEIAAGVVTVPVSALVATGDGGYAVEAVTSDGGTQYVAVDPGMFSDGFVEVAGIQPGTQVVVSS